MIYFLNTCFHKYRTWVNINKIAIIPYDTMIFNIIFCNKFLHFLVTYVDF